MKGTLVIDAGEDIVGIYDVRKRKYRPYRGKKISVALARVTEANEIVTYNGNAYDLTQLNKFAGLLGEEELSLKGIHSDMREIIWSERIWGMSLINTYCKHFEKAPKFPDSYEGSNQSDCYMTFKLWELWKQGKLKILDGHEVHI